MTAQPDLESNRLAARISLWPWFAGGFVILISAAVLLGWVLGNETLKRVLPGFVAMNPVTAIAFLAGGSGLSLLARARSARANAMFMGTVGLLVLCRYVFGWDTGIDRLFFGQQAAGNPIAPTTAFNFVLIAIAMWMSSKSENAHRAQLFALTVALLSLLAVIGYSYGVEKLYRLSTFIAMALHTAVNFVLLSTGILCLQPAHGIMARVTSARAGGGMLRRLLVPTLLVPPVLGWLILRAHRAGWLEPALGFSLFVVAVIPFLARTVWRNAHLLDLEDARRDEAQARLRETHAGLETTVQERTREVTQAIEGIRDGLQILGTSASQILASSTHLAASANETATSVAETTTTVEQVRQTARLSADRAKRVAASAQKVADISTAGTEATQSTAQGMERVREKMRAIGESMIQLSDQGRTIAEIITAVDDLAEQSNLLSVNAAIEAAAVGEEGKGFAVVSDEMKYLAAQSRDATKQVRTILTDIQNATGAAMRTTEQASKALDASIAQAARAGESILGLETNVNEAARVASEIATSSEEQLTGMEHIVLAMEQIKQASAENVDQARTLESSARGLSALGSRLQELADRHAKGSAA